MEKIFQKALNDVSLKIVSLTSWASENPQHKELIYAALDQALQKNPGAFSSVSHAALDGGFALSVYPVGFDIEISARVSKETIARISSPEELELAPSFASLWCAKEAAFKALRTFKQPQIVSQIKINFDKNHQDRSAVFRVENEKDFGASQGLGVTYHTSTLTYCVLIFRGDF